VVSPDTPISEAAKKMRDRDIGSVLVGSEDKLVGIVTDRDIVIRSLAQNGSQKVQDVMTPKVLYCFEDDTIESVSENFAKNQVHRLPVLDRNKRLVGVVSLGDLSRKHDKEGVCTACFGIHASTKREKE
jgi:CBS domain-containing protein